MIMINNAKKIIPLVDKMNPDVACTQKSKLYTIEMRQLGNKFIKLLCFIQKQQ